MLSSALSATSLELSASNSNLTVTWTVATQTGGAAISGYLIRINSGYGTAYLAAVTKLSSDTTHTFSGLLEGATYRV